MNILLSNDDGVYAPGINSLYKSLSKIGNVTVVAPEVDRSAAGKSLTLSAPLRPRVLDNGFIAVNGTPTDCVHLAITELLDIKPDLVVAGINAGANLGDDVLYSGTVAAATEGFFFGIPALAFSLTGDISKKNFDKAANLAMKFTEYFIKSDIDKKVILNVNFPCQTTHDFDSTSALSPMSKEIIVARLGQRHKAKAMVKSKDPNGREVYWIGLPGEKQDSGPGTDFHAVGSGFISVTPLQMDLTHHRKLESVSSWLKVFELA